MSVWSQNEACTLRSWRRFAVGAMIVRKEGGCNAICGSRGRWPRRASDTSSHVGVTSLERIGFRGASFGLPVQSASEAGEAGGMPWGLIGVGIVVGIVVGAPRLFIPFHLTNNSVTTPTLISLAMAAGAGSAAFVSFFYDRVRRKLSTRLTFILAFLLIGLGLGVIGMTHTFATTVFGVLISGIGIGMAVPNLFAFAASSSGNYDRPRAIGLARGAFLAAPMLAVRARTFGQGRRADGCDRRGLPCWRCSSLRVSGR